MKKTIAMILVVVLCCAASVGLTVAYLTDRDSAANIFTVGNVAIDLTEDFEQGATLIPGVDINKEPYITNIGNTDAWVWATVAIPAALDEEYAYNNVVHFNFAPESVNADEWTWTDDAGKWMVRTEKIDEVEYNVYTILYQTALKPGETTESPFMTKVYVDPHIDIDPDGNWWHVEGGVVTGKTDGEGNQVAFWNSNTNGNPVFYVSAYAIQEDTFANVRDAYAAYNKQWDNPNTTDKVEGTEYANVIEAKPASGAVRPAGYAPKVEGETIDNMVIIDKSDENTNLRALYKNGITGDLTVKNSYLDGTYAMNVTADATAEANLICENTAFLGWTSYSGWKTATFTNCTFQVNTNPELYNVIRPYDDTTFTGCEFKGTDLWLDNMGTSTINFVNCTYNGQPLTAEILNSMIVYAPTGTVQINGAAFTYPPANP